MRWMPPCRSRPRLIVLFGGYRYHTETATTTRTNPMRSRRFLGILLALPCRHAADGGAVEFELDLVGDPEHDGVLAEARHGAVQPARGHDAIAHFQNASESPGPVASCSRRCRPQSSRSLLVMVPVFSAHCATGSRTSASCVVSVGW